MNNVSKINKTTLPKDFNPLVYKEINDDLIDLNIGQMSDHFIRYGISEGRSYKKNQDI